MMPRVLSAPGDDHAPLCATLLLGQRGPVPGFGQAHPIAALAVGLGSPKAPSCPLPRPRHTRGDPLPVPSYTRWRGRAGPRALGLAAGGHPHPSPPGTSSPDSTSLAQPDYPQSTSQPADKQSVSGCPLSPPLRTDPPLGRLHIPTAFHTGTIPSLEGHLQELSRVGREVWG